MYASVRASLLMSACASPSRREIGNIYIYRNVCPGLFIELQMSEHGAHYAIYVVAASCKDHYLPHESLNSAAFLLPGDYFPAGQYDILSTRR